MRTESGRRECTGWIRTGALLALRIKAEDSRLSPVEQLRRATDHTHTQREKEKNDDNNTEREGKWGRERQGVMEEHGRC